MDAKATIDRLTYIEPNEYAGLNAYRNNNSDIPGLTTLSWNQEDLAMSVDLQVVIPNRDDAGQVSYLVNVDGGSVNFNNTQARRVSYMEGIPYNDAVNSPSVLTDNYTNICYKEVSEGKVVDKESLGINSINIDFDAHFFPVVTINFTDVRGAALFMVSEEEFKQSLNKDNTGDAVGSFFKALFRFPYPRFLLSVKGFYGTKVTFQLAVSDFKSNFNSDNGNFDMTIQFIGYVYGLYTDLPFDLIMASPYYNSDYWNKQIQRGIFKYVSSNGGDGSDMLTYVQFLTNVFKKEIDKDALQNAPETATLLKAKRAIPELQKICKLYRQLAESEPKSTLNLSDIELAYKAQTKRTTDKNTFRWGLSTYLGNATAQYYVTRSNCGILLDENIAKSLYKQLQVIFNDFPEYAPIIEKNNIFLNSFYRKKVNNKNLTSADIKGDTDCIYLQLFSRVNIGTTLTNYFEFENDNSFVIKDNTNFKDYITTMGGGDQDLLDDGIFAIGSNMLSDSDVLAKYVKEHPGELKPSTTAAFLIPVETDIKCFENLISDLENKVRNYEDRITDELKTAYANVIGFEPTVENYYRMLFAHIDCFMHFYFEHTLNKVQLDKKQGRRTLEALGISAYETDVPKRFANGNKNEVSVFPFPAYYTQYGTDKKIEIADFPGYATGKSVNFSKIPEVEAVNQILNGIREFKYDLEANVHGNGVITGNVFSPLSVLYDCKNPWDSLELSRTDDDKDIFHIIYFFICLLYADKLIGTDLDRTEAKKDDDTIITYYEQLARLLYKNIGENVSISFIQRLRSVISRIKGGGGMQYIINSLKDTYKLYGLKTDGGPNSDKIDIVNCDEEFKHCPAVLKITDNLLYSPAKFTANEDDNYTVDVNYPTNTKDFNNATLPDKACKIAIGNDYFLSGYSKEGLKDYYKTLVSYHYIDEYLSDRLEEKRQEFKEPQLPPSGCSECIEQYYAEMRELFNPTGPTKIGYIHLGGYNPNYFSSVEKTSSKSINELVVGVNFEHHEWKQEYSVMCRNHDSEVYDYLTEYYTNGFVNTTTTYTNPYNNIEFTGSRPMPIMTFVGRRHNGHKYTTTVTANYMEEEVEYDYVDDYPAVNLFSGVKKVVLSGQTLVEYQENTSNPTKSWEFYQVSNGSEPVYIPSDKQEEYMGLLYTRRCVGLVPVNVGYMLPDWNQLDNDQKKRAQYAFGTYFAALLSGNYLRKILSMFSGNNRNIVARKADLLYLGGSLYFAQGWNAWYNGLATKDRYKICDLLDEYGNLSYGLRKDDTMGYMGNTPKTDNKNEPINVTWMFTDVNNNKNDFIAQKLIKYFTDWCDNELFGGLNMYTKLAKVPVDVNDESNIYTIVNGYMSNISSPENPNDGGSYCFTVSYTKDGVCEKWLTDLTLSYEFAILLDASTYHIRKSDNLLTRTCQITKHDVVSFLDSFYEKLGGRLVQYEERQKKLENGETIALPVDQRRATYYLLKNLYDKWLCSYTFNDFRLHEPNVDLDIRNERFSKLNMKNNSSEYNNFIYIDQLYNDISSTFIMNTDKIARKIDDVYRGNSKMDIYSLMSFMAETNNLMLLALPVYTNMYRPDNVEKIFTPNTLYNIKSGDNCNGVGTTYVVMYTSEVSHQPGDFNDYDYNRDYIDIADVLHTHTQCLDLKLFSTNGKNSSDLNYNVTAFGVTYSKQNQMYFKRINVNMDNPKVTDESIRNMLILADGGSQGDTDQPISNGQNIYSIYSNRSYTCTVEMMGCANIMPLMYFQLNNIPMFRGLYLIINVKHTIKAGDMTTIFTGVRVSRYSLPNVKDIIFNSDVFKKLLQSDAWKTGGELVVDCSKIDSAPTSPLDSKIKMNKMDFHVYDRGNTTIEHIILHYTAGGNSKRCAAWKYKDVWKNTSSASAEFVVDDNDIVQYIEDIEHHSSGAIKGDPHNHITNKNSISIEICSSLKEGYSGKYANHEGWYFTEKTLENTEYLVKLLCRKFGIPMDKEHIVRHFDTASGKLCPGIKGWNTGQLYDNNGNPTGQQNTEEEYLNFIQRLKG